MAQADWRERFPEDVTCIRCLEVKPVQELDRLLWCENCLATARRRATLQGWGVGVGLVALLSLYIGLIVRPDLSLIPGAWVATLVVAFYLGSKVAREVLFGLDRVRNRKAAEAEPPPPGTLPGP